MIGILKRLLGIPATAADFVRRGDWHMECGRPEEAITAYTAAVRLDPDSPLGYLKRGSAYPDGQEAAAIADLTKAIQLDGKSATAYYRRGIAYRNQGAVSKAVADLSEAVRLDPTLTDAHTARATLRSIQSTRDAADGEGHLQRSLLDYSRAIELDPANPALYEMRARAYEAAGDRAKAAADTQKAKELRS